MKLSYEAKQIILLLAYLLLPLLSIKLAAYVVGDNWMDSRLSLFIALVGFAIAIGGVIRFMKNVEKIDSRNGYRNS